MKNGKFRKVLPKKPTNFIPVYLCIALFLFGFAILSMGQQWENAPMSKISSIVLRNSAVVNLVSDIELSNQYNSRNKTEAFDDLLITKSERTVYSRDLVMGLAANMDEKYFSIFCGSIREATATATVLVFINYPVSEKLWEIAKTYLIDVVEYDLTTITPAFLRTYHPSTLRWILFHRVLQQNNRSLIRDHDRVLFADVRDTYFQQNPFLLLPETSGKFYGIAENSFETIGTCAWNNKWVSDCFGEHVLALLYDASVVCSGVSLGTMDMASEYLAIVTTIMTGNSRLGKFPSCERNGVDQGVHNAVLHLGLLPHSSIRVETDFPITHLQSSPDSGIADANEPTQVYIGYTNRAVVVHQYDRISSLQAALAKKYVYWMDVSNEKLVWNSEATCGKYWYVNNMDMFAGRCEFGATRAMTSANCCNFCDLKRKESKEGCMAFAFSEGVCYFKSCSPELIKSTVVSNPRLFGLPLNVSESKFAIGTIENKINAQNSLMSAFLKEVL